MINSVNTLSRALKELAKTRQTSCDDFMPTTSLRKKALANFLDINDGLLNKYLKELGLVPSFGVQKINQQPEPLKTSEIRNFYNNSKFNINIVNGKFDKKSSNLPKNVQITNISDLDEKELDLVLGSEFLKPTNITLINTALVKRGFLLKASKSTKNRQININYINNFNVSSFNQMRNVYVFEKNTQLSIVEQFFSLEGGGPQLNNTVSDFKLKEGAKVDVYSWDSMSNLPDSKNTMNTFVSQKQNSSFDLFNIYLDTSWIKHSIGAALEGGQSNCNLYSIALLNKEQYVDSDIYVSHQAPDCVSNQFYKGVFDHNSTGVFNSLVFVAQNAQNTKAAQQNNNIILSDYARTKSNPQLEIFADEVECAHGSTVGQIDKNALFYLQSRGINKVLANSLLLRSFLNDVVEKANSQNAKKCVLLALNDKLRILN